MFEQNKQTICSFLFGIIFWVLVPYIHLGVIYSYWTPQKKPVDRGHCLNTCWDTIFKGSYQYSMETGYKHIYFNVTSNTFKIWFVTVIFILGMYEAFRYLIGLALQRTVRLPMFLLFCVVFYPHYYGWWSYFGYYNDDFYLQWNHQTFFTLTELVSTLMVLYLCNSQNQIESRMCLVIACIATVHIFVSGIDQFVVNILYGAGFWHQKVRDVGFMMPDLLHLFISIYYIYQVRNEKCINLRDIGVFCFSTIFLCILCNNL